MLASEAGFALGSMIGGSPAMVALYRMAWNGIASVSEVFREALSLPWDGLLVSRSSSLTEPKKQQQRNVIAATMKERVGSVTVAQGSYKE